MLPFMLIKFQIKRILSWMATHRWNGWWYTSLYLNYFN